MTFVPTELAYLALLFGLLVLPKALQRLRLPSAVTSLLLGVGLGTGLGWFAGDQTIHLLSTFGIAALFLFAGLEVDADDLRTGSRVIAEHLTISIATLVLVALVLADVFLISGRAATLFALALLTPSTGFILDSLRALGVTEEERYWIKTKAIASELLALAILFVTLQSTSTLRLGASAVALIALAALLPGLFRFLAARIVPYAPNSEFAFLLMVAVVYAYATRSLGVYYLVGAFLVGVAARRMQQRIPLLASDKNVHAVEVFATFFIPFYFFNAGASVPAGAFSWTAVAVGLGLILVLVPIRVALVVAQRKLTLAEDWRKATRVGIPLIPTLIFTLVLATILREQYQLSPTLFGALVVYAVLGTVIPTFVFGAPTSALEFSEPMVAPSDVAGQSALRVPGPAGASATPPSIPLAGADDDDRADA